MKRAFFLLLPTFAIVATLYVLPGLVRADEKKNRGKSSGLIAKEIMHLQPHKIYVADFLDGSGARTDKGCYFASVFSTNLKDQASGIEVLNRIDAQRLLTKTGIASSDLQTPETLPKIAAVTGADVILTGTFLQEKSSITLELSLRESATGKELYHTQYRERRTDGFEALFPAAMDIAGTIYYFAGLDGLSQPTCEYCPPPNYSEKARAEKYQGTVVLRAVVTPEGRATNIVVLKSPDGSLAEKALEAARIWRFKPARDKEGKPVAVRIPIEVTFRLYP